MERQLDMDFSPPKSFRFSLQDFKIGAIYRLGARRGMSRNIVVSLLVDRARFKPEAAKQLASHWLTTEPFRNCHTGRCLPTACPTKKWPRASGYRSEASAPKFGASDTLMSICGAPRDLASAANREDEMSGASLRGKGRAYAFLLALVGHTGDECVIWPFAKNHKGYGQLIHEGQGHKANRLMCEMTHGKPPTPEHQAAHTCGNGHMSCVNPNHLEWKTNYENQMDRAVHGTMPKHGRPARILTPEQIVEVRALKGAVAQYDLAKRFGVKPGCIEYWQSHDKPPKRVTDDQVRAIRAAGAKMTQAEVSRTLGIGVGTIQKILSGVSFRDVA